MINSSCRSFNILINVNETSVFIVGDLNKFSSLSSINIPGTLIGWISTLGNNMLILSFNQFGNFEL